MKQTLLFLLLVVWLVQVSFALLGPNKLSHHRSFRAVLNAKISVKRGTEVFSIDYDVIHRQAGEIPVIVIHGGPGLPSNYLYPMKDLVENRSLVFYDQLGCGKSDEPKDLSHYSIDKSVDDLVELLRVLNLPKFHLYGHSYGGILAFEYVKRERPTNCLSVILSSTPGDVAVTIADWESLENALAKRVLPMSVSEEFRRNYACRTPSTPRPLLDAYQRAGSVWSTINVIPDYRAVIESPLKSPPDLITRGQYDFVSSANQELYRDCFENDEYLELADCSHHGLLEHPNFYVSVLESFWKSTERQTKNSIPIQSPVEDRYTQDDPHAKG